MYHIYICLIGLQDYIVVESRKQICLNGVPREKIISAVIIDRTGLLTKIYNSDGGGCIHRRRDAMYMKCPDLIGRVAGIGDVGGPSLIRIRSP